MFNKKKPKQRQQVARYFEDAGARSKIREKAITEWETICQDFPDLDDSDAGLCCDLEFWGGIKWAEIRLPASEYRIALERQLARLKAGAPIDGYDDTTIGDKSTECSGGLCWESAELWGGRLAMRFVPAEGPSRGSQRSRYRDHPCPLDYRENPSTYGCFYNCRFFNPRKMDRSKKRGQRITTPEAIPLYEAALARLDEESKPDAE